MRSSKEELVGKISDTIEHEQKRAKKDALGTRLEFRCKSGNHSENESRNNAWMNLKTGGAWCFSCKCWYQPREVADMFGVSLDKFDFCTYGKNEVLEDVYEWKNSEGKIQKQRIKLRSVIDPSEKKFNSLSESIPGCLEIDKPGAESGKHTGTFYCMDEIVAAININPAAEILMVEGEKGANIARQAGLVASCTGGVDADKKIEDWCFELLKHANVTIWRDFDNDITTPRGKVKNNAIDWQNRLIARIDKFKESGKLRFVEVEKLGLPESGDFFDWMKANPVESIVTLDGLVPITTLQEKISDENAIVPSEKADVEYKQYPHTVDGIIPSRATVFFFSRPKVGKTRAMDEVVRCVASGRDFLGKYTTRKRDVVVFSLEDNEEFYMGRWKEQAIGDKPFDFPSNVRVMFNMPSIPNDGISHLARYIKRHPNVGLYVIDPFALFLGSDPNKSGRNMSEDMEIMKSLLMICLNNDCSMVFVNHDTKGNPDEKNDENPMDKMYGGRGLTAGAHTLIGIRRPNREPVSAWHIQTRNLGELAERAIAMKFLNGKWQYVSDSYIEGHDALTKEIVDVIAHIGGTASMREIHDQMKDLVTIETLRKRVRKAKSSGAVIFDGDKYLVPESIAKQWGAPIRNQQQLLS